MNLSRRTCLAALAAPGVALAAPALARAAGPDTDAALVEDAFRTLHPGLLRYNTPATLTRSFARLRSELAGAGAPGAQWLALTRFTARVRCGHTFVNANNQEGAGDAFFAAGRDRLPFGYRWLDGRMIVHRPAGSVLSPGDEVLRLANHDVRPLLAATMALAAADGGADGKRRRLAELDDRELWPLPDVALPRLIPDAFGDSTMVLTVRGRDGRRRETAVPLWTRAERVAARGSADFAPKDGPAWTSQVLADRSRFLTMPTWALYNSRWDWAAWLDGEVDAAIAATAPAIVLDLRGNAGGIECGDRLLARMIDRDLVRPDAARFVRYRRTPPRLDPYLTTWDRSFRDWGERAVGPDARGFYRMTKWDADARGDVIRPRGPRYGGRLIAMIDAENSSATFQFAQTVKANRLGTLVGETTGGNRRGINGGAYFFLRLPQCGFALDLPLVATFPAASQPDAGIAPDVEIRVRPQDVRDGLDPARAAALKAVRATA